MSMCMYLRRVSDADAARFRRDPDSVLAATLGAEFGENPASIVADSFFNINGFNDAFDHPRGFFGWVKAWLIKRALKSLVRSQLEQLRRAQSAMTTPGSQVGASDIPTPDAMVDLHKSWQILHYVLTGTPDSGPAPLNLLLVGGEDVGDDLGYGPARFIEPRLMQDFARALSAFDLNIALGRISPARMAAAGVYGADFDDDEDAADFSDLTKEVALYFQSLKEFAFTAAATRQGALIWIA